MNGTLPKRTSKFEAIAVLGRDSLDSSILKIFIRHIAVAKRAAKPHTLLDAMKQLYPHGYLDFRGYEGLLNSPETAPTLCKDFSNPPCLAVDLFALAGFLLMKSGGYHRISPFVDGAEGPQMVLVSEDDRDEWVETGRQWRAEGSRTLVTSPDALLTFWQQVLKYKNKPLYLRSTPIGPRPWWKPAMALLAIADEAAKDLGFESGKTKSAQAAFSETSMRKTIARGTKVFTLSSASSDQACVLPKSRTPKVGCTMRSLSHHLALLPPRGMARAYWSPHPELRKGETLTSAEAPFNVVVIPSPFQIRATAFKGTPAGEATWGWFHVEPHWCPSSRERQRIEDGFEAFWTFVKGTIDAASADVGTIHGLIFPEAALSTEVLRRLCRRLEEIPEFELLVAGLFDVIDEKGAVRDGNFAAMARRQRGPSEGMLFDVSSREKHHRWRVEKSQIEAYSLGAALDANRGWWESIHILDRSLDVFVLRGGATVTTLICEDLARSEPCQELVRGIGPNLVIALLMDGPQLKDRWPARYATVLAEDPGSSVLTVTSLGLIERGNKTGQFPASDKIGLWRDDTGRTVELSLGKDAQGLCLSLQPSAIRERTLDGRHDEAGAQSWRLTGVSPVRVANANQDILKGLWPDTD